ncbi:helix-turn-helix transcriptional regulator [uncultured Methylobacterium sp.]|uniref:helix-turn-helix domain-containing protein n=1 Tax=uncultured Methylobacterium sp. TaxID=157278 RepID=UPI00260CED33|nr:helix-turn-helix transcriptional regulator [uncultured Methylobacterium sp.]
MQHETAKDVHVVNEYYCENLGAPFTVVLINSVRVVPDQDTGNKKVHIPDMPGLISAVVRTRMMHPRKLNGAELKFLRHALSLKAITVANFLEMSPEHLSRCENGDRVMSSASEKQLRLASFMGTFFEDPEAVFSDSKDVDVAEMKKAKIDKRIETIIKFFFTMKIKSTYKNEDIVIKLTRKGQPRNFYLPAPECELEDSEWEVEEPIAA